MKLVPCTSLFTFLSLALGAGSSMSPRVAALGWLLGTTISLAAGVTYGLGARSRGAALAGGPVAGGVPILVGCGLAAVFGPVTLSGLVVAVAVGVAAGSVGAFAALAMRRSLTIATVK